MKVLRWAAWASVVLLGIILSIKNLREPDVWWMLLTGKTILEQGSVMSSDIFSFTFQGVSWINVKWGFEVLLAVFDKMGGPDFLMFIQVIATSLILWFIHKNYHSFNEILGRRSGLPSVALVAVSLLTLLAIEYRFLGRPEMTTHVMLGVFLLFLVKYRFSPSKDIYWLVALQVLWTNMHEAFGTGVVMMLGATIAMWVEHRYAQTRDDLPEIAQPKELTIATILAILGGAMHPSGTKMILHPLEIFTQTEVNKYTTENAGFTSGLYWEYQAFIAVAFFLVGAFFLFYNFRQDNTKWWLRPITNLGLGYAGLFLSFFYLALTMYRNIPLFLIFAAPILAVGLNELASRLSVGTVVKKAALGGLMVIALGLYGMVGSGAYYNAVNEQEQYGLRVAPDYNPVGAGQFIARTGLDGRCFSDYLISSYLLWDLYPTFQSYIDLRDLDIFTPEHFQEFARITVDPASFIKKDEEQLFRYAVLYRLQYPALHHFLHNDPNWVLCFVDPVAAVYVKNVPMNEEIIQEYGFTNKGDIFTEPVSPKPSGLSNAISTILWPPYNWEDRNPVNYDLIAASYYLYLQQFDLALARAKKAIDFDKDSKWRAMEMQGTIFLRMAETEQDVSKRSGYLSQAATLYNQAIKIHEKTPELLLGLGLVYSAGGNWADATHYLKECVKLDSRNFDGWVSLAIVQNQMSQQNPSADPRGLENWISYMEKAHNIDPTNPLIRFNLGVGYCKVARCKDAVRVLKDVLDLPGMNEQDVQYAKDCYQRCLGVN